MAIWLHTAILATSLAATVTEGLASATIVAGSYTVAAPKADLLEIVADADQYLTVETRADGLSVLNRVPID